MDEIHERQDAELNRLYDKLNTLEPGTDEYEKLLSEITKATTVRNENRKIEIAETEAKTCKSNAKKDIAIKVATIVTGVLLTPVIDYALKRSMVNVIGKVEQMETFTSTAGRSMSSWFKWK